MTQLLLSVPVPNRSSLAGHLTRSLKALDGGGARERAFRFRPRSKRKTTFRCRHRSYNKRPTATPNDFLTIGTRVWVAERLVLPLDDGSQQEAPRRATRRRQWATERILQTLPQDYLIQVDRSKKQFVLLAPHGSEVELRSQAPSLALPR